MRSLRDSDLSKKIASQYYEYYHMNRKMDSRLSFFKDIGTADFQFKALTTAVSGGANSLLIDGERLISEIDRKISSLRDC